MTDITDPRLIKLKGLLFLFVGLLSAALLIFEHPTLKVGLLLAICVWCFCRFYYFVPRPRDDRTLPGPRLSFLRALVVCAVSLAATEAKGFIQSW